MKKTLQLLSISTICLPLILFSQASIANTAEAFAACAKEEDSLKRLMCYDNASKASATSQGSKQNASKSDTPSIEIKAAGTTGSTIYEGQTPSNSVADKSSAEKTNIKNDVDSPADVKPVVISQGQTPSNSAINQSNKKSTSKNEAAKTVDENVEVISQGQTPTNAAQSKKEITFNAEDSFGEEEKVVRQSLEEVTFTVTSLSKNPYKQWVLTFSNGQVWGQKDDDQYIKFAVGDKVKIKRGFFGAFYLNDADGNRRVRVKRIK